MNCDLHTHTVHSDGSYTPEELVLAAKEKNLIIALTDHNTVSGLPEFMAEADRLGVAAVGGTELSCVYGGREFHLLGLFIPTEFYGELERLCVEYHRLKERSNIDLIDKLRGLGYDISYTEIQKRNVKGRVNRAHIATELFEKGYVCSVSEAFDKLLFEGGGFYEPAEKLDFFEAVRFLRSIRALPVLAHPLKDINEEALRDILPKAIEAGLIGIEVLHSSYGEAEVRICDRIADEFGLIKSGGSDFHGKAKPDVFLGTGKGNMCVPSIYYTELVKKHTELAGGEYVKL